MLRSTGDRVVIVGGGIAGALLAKTLQNHADVVLIDPYAIVVVSSISPSSIFLILIRMDG